MKYFNLFGDEVDSYTTHPHLSKKKPSKSRTSSSFDYFNLDIFGSLPTAGREQMPVLEPYNGQIPDRMVAFDEAYTKNDTGCIVHFYEDDRRFMRIFRNPDKYMDFLCSCALVIEPDLSQYVNMPYPIRYAHAYLNRAMAAYLQRNGANVVSNLTWSLRDSYSYSIAGRPQNSIVAVNCTGILGHDISKYLWMEGYENVVLPLNPTYIIRYGDRMPNECTEKSVYFDNERLKRMRYGC